ncbi:SPP1 (predicted) [Pycnogonum litorale]
MNADNSVFTANVDIPNKVLTEFQNSLKFLKDEHISAIADRKGWLTDIHMLAASKIIKMHAPHIAGLEDTILLHSQNIKHPNKEFIQFFNMENTHWITVSNVNSHFGEVNIYDSLTSTLKRDAVSEICGFVKSKTNTLKLNFKNVDQQTDASSCGIYAVAFAVTLATGRDPVNITYSGDLRGEFIISLQKKILFQFATKDIYRPLDTLKTEEVDIYCICRMPDNRILMICCDKCDEWFHSTCVNLGKIPRKRKKWYCQSCQEDDRNQ